MKIINDILSAVIGAGVIQGIFLALVLFRSRRGSRRSNVFLGLIMTGFSLNILHSIVFIDILFKDMPHLSKINEPFQFIFGPLLYFYVRELTGPMLSFKKNDFMHFIPFLLYTIFILPLNYLAGNMGIYSFLRQNINITSIIVWGLMFLQITFYVAASFKIIWKYKKSILKEYSSLEKIDLHWLHAFFFILIALYLVYPILFAWLIHGNPYPYFSKILSLVSAVAIYGLGYRGLLQDEIFLTADVSRNKSKTADKKYEKSGLDDTEAETLKTRLLKFMETEKLYLDPEITLPVLADRIGVPRNRLSQVINGYLNTTFYDLINSYRLEEAKRLIANPDNSHIKILALAYDAGFNSKPAFNNVFKKTTGFTPSQYRKKHST